jgi:hypothetical protein
MRVMSRFDHLAPEELEQIKRMIEEMDAVEVVDEELRELVEKHWPWLEKKLSTQKPIAKSFHAKPRARSRKG